MASLSSVKAGDTGRGGTRGSNPELAQGSFFATPPTPDNPNGTDNGRPAVSAFTSPWQFPVYGSRDGNFQYPGFGQAPIAFQADQGGAPAPAPSPSPAPGGATPTPSPTGGPAPTDSSGPLAPGDSSGGSDAGSGNSGDGNGGTFGGSDLSGGNPGGTPNGAFGSPDLGGFSVDGALGGAAIGGAIGGPAGAIAGGAFGGFGGFGAFGGTEDSQDGTGSADQGSDSGVGSDSGASADASAGEGGAASGGDSGDAGSAGDAGGDAGAGDAGGGGDAGAGGDGGNGGDGGGDGGGGGFSRGGFRGGRAFGHGANLGGSGMRRGMGSSGFRGIQAGSRGAYGRSADPTTIASGALDNAPNMVNAAPKMDPMPGFNSPPVAAARGGAMHYAEGGEVGDDIPHYPSAEGMSPQQRDQYVGALSSGSGNGDLPGELHRAISSVLERFTGRGLDPQGGAPQGPQAPPQGPQPGYASGGIVDNASQDFSNWFQGGQGAGMPPAMPPVQQTGADVSGNGGAQAARFDARSYSPALAQGAGGGGAAAAPSSGGGGSGIFGSGISGGDVAAIGSLFLNRGGPVRRYAAGGPVSGDAAMGADPTLGSGQDASSPVPGAGGGQGYAGAVSGPGGPIDDAIPAQLSNGEFVEDANTVRYFGVPFFQKLQQIAAQATGGGPGVDPSTGAVAPPGQGGPGPNEEANSQFDDDGDEGPGYGGGAPFGVQNSDDDFLTQQEQSVGPGGGAGMAPGGMGMNPAPTFGNSTSATSPQPIQPRDMRSQGIPPMQGGNGPDEAARKGFVNSRSVPMDTGTQGQGKNVRTAGGLRSLHAR